MKKVLFLLSLLTTALMFAQSPSLQWKKVSKGSFSGDETVFCSARDNSGNNYLCGYNASSTWIAKFDNTGANTFSFNYVDSSNAYITPAKLFVDGSGNIYMVGSKYDNGNVNPIIVKFDAQGNVIWTHGYVNNSYNTVDDALIDNATSPNFIFYTGRLNDSLGIVKVNATTGAMVWAKRFNPSGNLYSRGTELAYLNGNIYSTGVTYSPTTYLNGYTVKLNSSGTLFYSHETNFPGVDVSEHIIVNSSGDAFVYGYESSLGFPRFSLTRLSTGGNLLWMTNLTPTISGGGSPSNLQSVGMASNISNTLFFIVGNGFNPNNSLRCEYTFVVNSSGTVVSEEEYTNGSNLDQFAIKADNSGNFFVLGKQENGNLLYVSKFPNTGGPASYRSSYVINSAYNPVDLFLDNSSNVYASSNIYRNSINLGDGLIVKFGQSGNLIWDGIYDGEANGFDVGERVYVSSNGMDIYTAGVIQNNGTGRDVVVKLYDEMGNEQWATTIDQNGDNENLLDMTQDQYNVSHIMYYSGTQGYITKIDNIGSQLYNIPVPFSYGRIKENRNTYGVYIGQDGNYNSLDFAIRAYDFGGNFQFANTPAFYSGGYTQVRAMEYDNAGNVYVFGDIYDPGTSYSKLAVQKFSNTGTKLFDVTLNGFDNVFYKDAVSMKFDNNGALVLMGYGVKAGESKRSIAFARITTSGVLSSTVFYSHQANVVDMTPNGFIFDANNNVIVYGRKELSGPQYNAFVAAFDPNFSLQWINIINNPNNGQGDVINAATLSGTDIYVTGVHTLPQNEQVIYTAKLNSSGAIQWEENYQSRFAGYNEGKSIAVNNNRVYVVGSANESPGQQYDMIAMKYCANPRPTVSVSGSPLICSNQAATLFATPGSFSYLWHPNGETFSSISASQSGYYSVTAIEYDGCERKSDSLQITIKAAPLAPIICAVTVDSLSTHNILQWDKSSYTDLDHFNIYREDATNIYTPIGSVPFDSLSEYHDYGANPNITTKRYKLSAVDTCGVESALSNYHNTIYITYSGNGQYNWNLYTIENSANPVTNYLLMRDSIGNGNWAQIGMTSGSQGTLNDPAFASYPQGRWRVETLWAIGCNPTRGAINTSRSNIKSPTSIGINDLVADAEISVYPNPASDNVTVKFPAVGETTSIAIYDALGKLVYSQKLKANQGEVKINTAELEAGLYLLQVSNSAGKATRKLFIE